jgi:cytochrome P450
LSGARRLFGNGLLTSDTSLHARQRRLVQPVFHRSRLEEYSRVITASGVEWRDAWREGDTLDIAAEMSRLTLAITSRILFGEDGDAVAARIRDPLEHTTSVLEVAVFPFAALTELLPLPHVRRFRAARAALDLAVHEVIQRRRKDPDGGADVVSLLITAQEEGTGACMSDTQVRDEVVTLLLASHETTANALAWTWYLLARHPGADARLHAEIDAVLEDGRVPITADLSALTYTRTVLAESMRLYPPAWLLARVAVEDHAVRGYVIPKGSFVVLSPWVVHRSGRYFSDPHKFEPDRWRAERQAGQPRFSYFPFGGGSRGCMGEAFAWMEGTLLLATVAQRWRIRLLDEAHPEIHPGLTLTPKSGIRVTVERRS